MLIKNSVTVTCLLFFLFLIALLAVATLATQIILGYSGFSQLNSKPNLVTLNSGCSNSYFVEKYVVGGVDSMKISFVCVVIVTLLIALVLFGVVSYICGCCKSSQESEETGIDINFEDRDRNNIFMEIQYPSTCQMASIFIILSVVAISSYVPFKIYTQYLIEQNNHICPLSLSNTQLRAISILNGLILLFDFIALVFVVIINCKLHSRMEKREKQRFSQSFRHQMHRIIEQIPESQRKLFGRKKEIVYQPREQRQPNLSNRLKSIMSEESRSSPKQKQNVWQVKQVESILYQQNPDLKLQSLVVQK